MVNGKCFMEDGRGKKLQFWQPFFGEDLITHLTQSREKPPRFSEIIKNFPIILTIVLAEPRRFHRLA